MKIGKKNAVIVAHPDDESLWAGSLLADRGPEFDVIVCSIPRREPERAWKFFDVAKLLGFHPRVYPVLEPSGANFPMTHLHNIDIWGYDLIVTHNEKGEYGHLHHRQVHDWVKREAKGEIAYFGYGIEGEELSHQNLEVKQQAIQCYDHPSALTDEPKYIELMRRYYPDGLTAETYVYA